MDHSRFWNKVNCSGECWLWTAAQDSHGYGLFRAVHKESMVLAHRHVWKITFGEIPKGICVLHKCDTPLCVNPDHLFLGTKLDNARDRDAKGRLNDRSGENHPRATLTRSDVEEIRAIAMPVCKRGTKADLGRKFGVSIQQISAIVLGKAWA